jgi:hypothetical protein
MEKVVALKNLNGEENKTVKNVSTRKEDEKIEQQIKGKYRNE